MGLSQPLADSSHWGGALRPEIQCHHYPEAWSLQVKVLSTKTCWTGQVLSIHVPNRFVLVSWCSRKTEVDMQFPSLIHSSSSRYAISFTEHFARWCHLLAEVLRRPQDTNSKRNVTWPTLSVCSKRRKCVFLVRVVEGQLLWFCLECCAHLVLQQTAHTDAVEVTVQALSQLLPSGEEFTPSPFKLAPDGHLSPEGRPSLQLQAQECGGLATGWCGAGVWAQGSGTVRLTSHVLQGTPKLYS